MCVARTRARIWHFHIISNSFFTNHPSLMLQTLSYSHYHSISYNSITYLPLTQMVCLYTVET